MQLFHTHHNIKKNKMFDSGLSLFELSVWLHVFSRSMIAVFIPILLLKIGYELKEVMIFYFMYCLFDVPLNFFAKFLTRRLGARIVIILGSFFSVGFFLCLYNLGPNNWSMLIIIAILAALYDVFYWVAHLYFFVKCSGDDSNLSDETSSLYIARQIGGILAPALGAVILIFFSKKVLILASVFVLILSIWPLFLIKGVNDMPKRNKNFKEFFARKNDFREYIGIGLFGLHSSAENVMWPIFIFITFGSMESVAFLPIIVSITTIIFTYFVGQIKRKERIKIVSLASLFIAFIWVLRIITQNNIFYYISVFLIGLFSVFVSIPIDSTLFEEGEKKDTLAASTYRNTASMFFKMIFYGILIFLVDIFQASFLIAIASMVLLIVSNFFLRGVRFKFQ